MTKTPSAYWKRRRRDEEMFGWEEEGKVKNVCDFAVSKKRREKSQNRKRIEREKSCC